MPQQVAGFVRSARLQPGGPLARSPWPRGTAGSSRPRVPKAPRRDVPPVDFPPGVVAAAQERCGGWCERCHRARATHSHHRLLRSQGGRGTLANCGRVCHVCHGEIHAYPTAAKADGWIVPRGQDPETMPVLVRLAADAEPVRVLLADTHLPMAGAV